MEEIKFIGTSAAILTVKAGNSKIIAGKYASYDQIRVGVIYMILKK